jgi:hypothetical protein
LEERRSSAARVAVAVLERLAPSDAAAAAARACGLFGLSFSSAVGIGIGGNSAESAGRERALQQAEDVFGGLFDEELIDLFALEFEADEQARVGKQIDETRHAAGQAVDDFDGGAGERARAAQAGSVETLGHVGANLGKAERTQQARAGDALLERLEFRPLKNGEQFGLAAENDLKQLFLIRVGVAEEANFFEQLHAHEVSFIDEQNRGATLLLRLEKHLVERSEATWLARGGAANFVFFEDGFEQLGRCERGIDEEGGDEAAAAFGFFGQNLQSGVEKSCLARADGPSDNGETLALQNTLQKNFERGAMRISQMKESGIRSETERFFFELIKGRVQIDLPRVPNSDCELQQNDAATERALFLPDSQFYNKHRVPG